MANTRLPQLGIAVVDWIDKYCEKVYLNMSGWYQSSRLKANNMKIVRNSDARSSTAEAALVLVQHIVIRTSDQGDMMLSDSKDENSTPVYWFSP